MFVSGANRCLDIVFSWRTELNRHSLPEHSALSIKEYPLYHCDGNIRVNFEVDDFWTIAMLRRRIEELGPNRRTSFCIS